MLVLRTSIHTLPAAKTQNADITPVTRTQIANLRRVSVVQAYPDKQNFGGVLLFRIQEKGVQGGFAVFGPPPLTQAVLDS